MGIFSSMFRKPVDKVSSQFRGNTALVDSHMKATHSNVSKHGDFTFEYLYTSSEPISQSGTYGSIIYIGVESLIHEFVSTLPVDLKEIQASLVFTKGF